MLPLLCRGFLDSDSASTFLSAAVHLEGEKDIVIYQEDLEGEVLGTTSFLLFLPEGSRAVIREWRVCSSHVKMKPLGPA